MTTVTYLSNEHISLQEKIAPFHFFADKESLTKGIPSMMKKLLLFLAIFCFSSSMHGQVSKTVNLTAAGSLSAVLSADELKTITNLTLTGSMDSRDFKVMRNDMPMLAVLDLSEVAIAAYNGIGGTDTYIIDYPANEVPPFAFFTFSLNRPPIIKKLQSVVLPSSVTSIGHRAFWDCNGLTTVTIPSSVTSIGKAAFANSSLTTVTIPSSLTSIGESTFMGCTELTTVTIPSSVASIGDSAFSQCARLTSITIPSSVTSIGKGAFASCYNVKTITIPSSVTSIEDYAFTDCSGAITVDSNNPDYSSLDGVLYDKAHTTLIHSPFTKTGSFTIPSSVTSIGNNAFARSKLTSVTIPSSVTSIGNFAFGGCDGLTTIAIPSSVTSIGDCAFYFCSGLTTVAIPSSFGKSAFEGCGRLTTVTIASSATSIGDDAFVRCYELTHVTIPSSVISIGRNAFSNCWGLTNITIPSSVTSIGESAFDDCRALTSITSTRPIPVDLSSTYNVFQGINKTNCTLYVPVGSRNAYEVEYQWKDFTNIVEDSNIPTAIEPINYEKQWTVYPNPTTGKIKLILDRIPANACWLTLVDRSGKTVLKQLIQGKEETIDLRGNPPGVYFIKTNLKDSRVQKIILR